MDVGRKEIVKKERERVKIEMTENFTLSATRQADPTLFYPFALFLVALSLRQIIHSQIDLNPRERMRIFVSIYQT